MSKSKRRLSKQSVRDKMAQRRNSRELAWAEAGYKEAMEKEKSQPIPHRSLLQKIYIRFISFRPIVWVRKAFYLLNRNRISA